MSKKLLLSILSFLVIVTICSSFILAEGTCDVCNETCSPCGGGCSATDLTEMFLEVGDFNNVVGNISGWDVSCITSMVGMFIDSDFNQNLGSWDISGVTDMSYMFNGVTLSTENYDALLNGWSSVVAIGDVVFDAGNSQYSSAGVDGRYWLTDEYGWSITDGGIYVPPEIGTNVTICRELNLTNSVYTMLNGLSISGAGTCLTITAQNITLDCGGFSIGGSVSSNQYGIKSISDNTTIKNCGLSNLGAGIYFYNGNYGTIDNIFGKSDAGIIFENYSNNNITNSNIETYGGVGVTFILSNYSILTNNNISSGGISISGSSSSYNTLTNNIISGGSDGLQLGSNNILINNTVSANMRVITISNYNTLINNTATAASGDWAIKIGSNNNLTDNHGICTSSTGIYLTGSNNILINNFGGHSFQGQRGISIIGGSNNILIGNEGKSSGYGIYLEATSNNNLTNNIGTSRNSASLYLVDSSNNILINNLGNGAGNQGLTLTGSNYNILIGNNATMSMGNDGIYFSNSSFNNLTNNIGTSDRDGIHLSSSNNNILINTLGSGDIVSGIYFDTSNNNFFINSSFNNVHYTYNDLWMLSGLNNTFLNCSYRTDDAYEVVGAGGELIRQWYYKANVTNLTGTPLSNVNVTLFNATNNYNFNLTTDVTGFTDMIVVTDYINNGGVRTYYSPYTIDAVLSPYLTNTHSYNASLGNNLNDVFLLELDTTPPYFTNNTPQNQTITYGNSLSYYINATDDVALDCFSVDNSNFNIDCSGHLTNIVSLSAGLYNLNITINDTSNNLNSTTILVNITQAIPSLSLGRTSPITYGIPTNFSGTGCPSQLTCTLNLTNGIFGVGDIYAMYYTFGNDNYTSSSVIESTTINKATGVIYTYLNNARANITTGIPMNISLNSSLSIGMGEVLLYYNGLLINNGTSPLYNMTEVNTTGFYNVTSSYLGNQNYTSAYETWWVNFTLDPYIPSVGGSISGYTFSQLSEPFYDMIVEYDSPWTFDTVNSITVLISNYSNNTIDIDNVKVELTTPGVTLTKTEVKNKVGEYIFRYNIPTQNITAINFKITATNGAKILTQDISIPISSAASPFLGITSAVTATGNFIDTHIGEILFFILFITVLLVIISFATKKR